MKTAFAIHKANLYKKSILIHSKTNKKSLLMMTGGIFFFYETIPIRYHGNKYNYIDARIVGI